MIYSLPERPDVPTAFRIPPSRMPPVILPPEQIEAVKTSIRQKGMLY